MKHSRHRVNDVTLHVVTAGADDAPLVLLLHGFPETWQAWERYVAPLLATGWRVVIPDQRGYGTSDKPGAVRDYVLDILADDVCALAAALGAERFALVGHDWGVSSRGTLRAGIPSASTGWPSSMHRTRRRCSATR